MVVAWKTLCSVAPAEGVQVRSICVAPTAVAPSPVGASGGGVSVVAVASDEFEEVVRRVDVEPVGGGNELGRGLGAEVGAPAGVARLDHVIVCR